jgi:hypothetical protein
LKKYLLYFLFLIPIFSGAQTMPGDFTFNFTFGNSREPTNYDDKKSILTVNGNDTTMKIRIVLTNEEKQNIYDKLREINFISYPEKYSYHHPDSEQAIVCTPCNGFYLTITTNGVIKTVNWSDCVQSRTKDEKHEALMQLNRLIQKIIWAYNPLKGYHPKYMEM